MINHIVIVSLVFFSFLFIGHRNLKRFLLFWGIFALPFSYDYTFHYFSGYSGWAQGFLIRLSDLFFLALYIVWVIGTRDRKPRRIKWKFLFPIFLFLAACILSITGSTWRMFCYFEIFQYCKIVFLYFYVPVRVLRSEGDLRFITHSLLAALCFQSLLAILQFLFQDFYSVLRTGMEAPVTIFGAFIRSQGTVGHPNGLAAFLVPALLICQALIISLRRRERFLYILSITLGLIGLILSFSRTGWISYLFCTFLLFLLGRRVRKDITRYLMVLIVIALVIVIFYPFMSTRLLTDDQGAFKDRWYLMLLAKEIIKDNYLVGIGINNYWFAMNHYIPDDYDWDFVYLVHNVFLYIFAETGILGFISVLLLFLLPLRTLYRYRRTADMQISNYALGLFACFSAMIIQNLVDLTWATPIINSYYFLLLALTLLLIDINRQKTESGEQ